MPGWATSLFITLYLAFFLIRDGGSVVRALRDARPMALFFLMSGAVWKGLVLIAWGVLVMITTLGGMAVFGLNGFVPGPAVAAMFLATWLIYGTKRV